jgi:hypothetical protein
LSIVYVRNFPCRAQALGIMVGSKGRFNPNGRLTRQEAAVAFSNLCRVAGLYDRPAPIAPFSDRGSVAGWATDALDFCAAKGVMTGYGGRFSPLGTFTRQEAVAALEKLAAARGWASYAPAA